jgi:predicted ATPase
MRDAFLGAVGFVTLQDTQPRGSLTDALSRQLGLPGEPQSDPLGRFVAAASGQPTLLILDNLEHVLGDAAAVVRRLLQETATLTCLATSRSPLAIEGEAEFRLAPLPVPPQPLDAAWVSQCPSVQLFVDRADRASPGFSLSVRNAGAVAEICSRLEGLPLALELAAARLNTMTLSQIRADLAEGSDRLVARRRDVPSRQRSLRATYEWSRALLSDPLRAFHAKLSVFPGEWTADAAMAVCVEPAASEYLADLYDWSLVHVCLDNDAGRTPRYGMLQSLRAYGREHVPRDEWSELRRSHAQYYAGLTQRLGGELSGPAPQACLRELEADLTNLRAAMEWLSGPDEDLATGLRMASALFSFWTTRGHLLEGSRLVEALLSRGDASQAGIDYARALETAGKLAYRQGDVRAAVTYCEKGLTACREADDHEGVARCLNALANAVAARGDAEGAQRRLREALDAARSIGDIGLEATTLHNMASVFFRRGDLAEVEALYEASLGLRRRLGARRGEADALIGLGNVAMQRGDSARAHRCYDQALEICRELGFSAGVAGCQQNLAILAERSADLRTALELHQDSLRIRRELHDRRGVADSVHGLAVVEHRRGNWARAKDLYAEALGLHREVGDRYGEGLALVGMGDLALDGGQVAQAQEFRDTGLPIAVDTGHKDAIARGLLLSARLCCRLREFERAAKLLGAAEAVIDAAGMSPPAQVAELEEVLTQSDSGRQTRLPEARALGRNATLDEAVRLAVGQG